MIELGIMLALLSGIRFLMDDYRSGLFLQLFAGALLIAAAFEALLVLSSDGDMVAFEATAINVILAFLANTIFGMFMMSLALYDAILVSGWEKEQGRRIPKNIKGAGILL
ncbi:MAG: hypothetical protein ACJKSS_00370 [Patescibacteria group bacterium UBA2103]